MSEDSFTEVSNESWFGRIGGAIKGLLFGLILIVGSFPLLFLNEGCAVKREKTLKEGAGAVVSVASDTIQESNGGKLVHLTGNAATNETLTDSTFGVSANALKLKRTVEMYQWKETSKKTTDKKIGGGTTTTTTYSYEMEWSKDLIDSSHFKKSDEHKNPATMPYSTSEMVANKVSLGAFVLSKSLVGMLDSYEPLPIASNTRLPVALSGKAQLQSSGIYIGANPSSPSVGDTRIKFEVIKPAEISVMAKQVNNTFEPYATKAGGTIELLETGAHSAAAMIQTAQDNNTMKTWILRGVGFFLMFIGFCLVASPLSVIADVLPFLGSMVGAGTGLISFLLAACLSLITIAIAWIVYRPVLGIILLVVAVGLMVLIKGKMNAAKAAS